MSLSLAQALDLLATDASYQTREGLVELARLTSVTTPADGTGRVPVTFAHSGNTAPDGTGPSTGSFTRTTGEASASGTAELAGSLLLANNNFYRQLIDDPALTAQAPNLTQMTGSGAVRELRLPTIS